VSAAEDALLHTVRQVTDSGDVQGAANLLQTHPELAARLARDFADRMLNGARPNFYGFQQFKSALVKMVGGEAAGLFLTQAPGAGSKRRVATMPLQGLQDYARQHGLLYQEILPSSAVYLPPPITSGKVRLDGFHAQTRTFFRCVLDDVIVPGKSNLLLCSGRALLDFQGAELDELPLDLDVDPAVVEARSRALTVLVPEAPQVIDEALSLVGVHTYAFGHWLHEFLPKVWACLGLPEFASLPIVVDAQMPTQHREALELFAGPHHPIVVLGPGQGLRVKRLWTCSMIMYLPPGPLPGSDAGSDSWAMDTRGYARLVEKARPCVERLGEPLQKHPRLYLTRKDSQHRRLVNREEVERWARSQGFEIVDLGELSFREQVQLIRGAEVILGPHGSASMVVYFARPGTRFGEFNHELIREYERYSQAEVYRELRIHHRILVGDIVARNPSYTTFSSYTVDVEALPAFLAELQSDV